MIKNYSDYELHGFRLYIISKILDNIVLASWTTLCKSATINIENIDSEDEDAIEEENKDPQQKAREGGEAGDNLVDMETKTEFKEDESLHDGKKEHPIDEETLVDS